MRIALVLTSHDQLGDTGHKTVFWPEEFAPRTLYSEMPASDLRSPLPKAASLLLIP